jgi:hypothetical protein
MAQDLYLKKYEIELKYKSQISTAEIDAAQSIDREAIRQQALLAQQQAAQLMQQQMQPPQQPQQQPQMQPQQMPQQQPPAPEMMTPSTFQGMAQ